MKSIISFAMINLAICSTAFSQVEQPPVTDTVKVEELYEDVPPPVEAVELPYYDEVAPVIDNYMVGSSFNIFKNNSKIRPEQKPDKKALYSAGTGELLIEISNQLTVPYTYTDDSKYVIIQFVVGKDSMLYNPQVLYTPGAEYSINATKVIESLQQKFIPATKNGKPVDSVIIIPIRFTKRSELYPAYPGSRS
jgi:hypothetical protein